MHEREGWLVASLIPKHLPHCQFLVHTTNATTGAQDLGTRLGSYIMNIV